ncbi:hypothetical protein CIW52_29720 [Mycolicibacterium sp. P9-64]|uniref:hypothetical protein n=1 Tax=Mycolicibacterium sp. P9-64 TaxID=2024612 RepID=UPI0011EF0B53|nr:hypothetical protein [Mycolicibacterium sp. P9-64]KAA0079193.1 hypothetical protein CIW52_29720 [Mycolicibacterium sp. P9-64]
MNLGRWTGVALVFVAAGAASSCVRTDEGVPVAASSVEATAKPLPGSEPPSGVSDQAPPGVVPTIQVPVPVDAVTCAAPGKPGAVVTAAVSDPTAPKITVSVPPGWNSSPGSGDVGARMDGPDGMSATVTIAPSGLDPAKAFRDYTDQVMSQSPVSSVSILPGELCDYSGQKLMGAWSDTPQNSVQFVDRIVHVWTNTKNFLVSVHVQAPTGVDQLDAAGKLLTEDFEVRLP